MSINGFPIQILLLKSKEEWTEVICRLLSLLLTLLFYNCDRKLEQNFRKYSFNHILKVCKALLKNQHVLLKECKHMTFL